MMGCVRFIGHAMVFSFRFPPFADFFQNAIGRSLVIFQNRGRPFSKTP